MKLLTINVVSKDLQLFEENNAELLKAASESNNVEINKIPFEDDKQYEIFCRLLKECDAKYILFLDESNILTPDSLSEILSALSEQYAPAFAMHLITELDKAVSKTAKTFKLGAVSKNLLCFNRFIFEADFLRGINLTHEDSSVFEEKILLCLNGEGDSLPLANCAKIFTSKALENDINSYEKQFKKEWYLNVFEELILPFLKSNRPTANQQRFIMYCLALRFYLNLNSRDKFAIEDEEIDRFFDLAIKTLTFIDDRYILEILNELHLPKSLAFHFLKLKSGENLKISMAGQNKNSFYLNYIHLGNDSIKLVINAINFEDNSLKFDGEILGSYMLEEVDDNFKVILNGKEVPHEQTFVYNITKAFGRSLLRPYSFSFEIPYDKANGELCFELNFAEKSITLPLLFQKTAARLIPYKFSYYTFANKTLRVSDRKILISKTRKYKIFFYEIMMILKSVFLRSSFKTGLIAALLRVLYWLAKPFYKKPIYIFFDKLYKAGDNAEYLFDYCVENFKDTNSYYIVNADSLDYKRLKAKYGKHVLKFNSLRQKLKVLHADTIFATHSPVLPFCGFGVSLQYCFRNLLKAKVVCIQHGLTIQNIAQYQNRLQDNTRMYFCASKYEIENLKNKVYGYTDELYLTGSPRYDGLVNRDQKQILIAPTWRRNIVITGNRIGTSKAYNPDFKKTKYFEIYNRLINDPRLTAAAAEKGYKIIFLIHPTLSSQVEDYDTNPYLEIIPAISDISYEKMLTESSIMLTDYSGIQFDFAYMKKPLLYYHPKELPPQYTEGVYKYETMSFGPIITEYDDIVASLCEYIENDCKMTNEYKARVDDFFAYTDRSNCERIMKIVKK